MSSKRETAPVVEETPKAECVHVSVDGPDLATAVAHRILLQNHLTGKVTRWAGSQGAKCAVLVIPKGKKSAGETLDALIQASPIPDWRDGYTYTIEVGVDPITDLAAEDEAWAAKNAPQGDPTDAPDAGALE